jgi:hypothetical protein
MQIINQIKKIKVIIFSFVIIVLSIFFVFFKLSTAQICTAPLYLLWSGNWQQNRVPISSSTTYYLTIDNSPIYVSGDKVGISVINPIYDLQVNGTISANEFCITSTSNTGFASCVNSWATGTVIVSGNPSPGQVAFWTGPSTISGDNNFFWSTSTNRLGINTTTPQTPLHVATSVMSNEFIGQINAKNISAGTFGGGNYYFMGNLVIGTTTPQRSLHATQYITSNTGFCINNNCIATFTNSQAGYWNLTNSILYASSTSWNVAIGTTTIDPTYKLQVAGGSVGITNGSLVIGNTPQRGNWNSRIPLNNITTIVDNSGRYASMTIAPDGLPIIAYFNVANNQLKVVKCTKSDCTFNTINIVDSSSGIKGPSIAIGSDGLPVIAYMRNNNLAFLRCNNDICSSTTSKIFNSIVVSSSPSISITIATSGVPAISYIDSSSTLKFLICSDLNCSSTTSDVIVDNSWPPDHYILRSAMTIGYNGFGIIGYYTYDTNFNPTTSLVFSWCTISTCLFQASFSLLDRINNTASSSLSITVGSDGLPIIAYMGFSASLNKDVLKVFKCNVYGARFVDCSTSYTISVISNSGSEPSITIAPDGLPIIAYRDVTANTVKVLKCGTLNCSLIASDVVIDYGSLPSIAIGSDGLPIVVYTGNDGKLRVVKCGSEFCVPHWTRR